MRSAAVGVTVAGPGTALAGTGQRKGRPRWHSRRGPSKQAFAAPIATSGSGIMRVRSSAPVRQVARPGPRPEPAASVRMGREQPCGGSRVD